MAHVTDTFQHSKSTIERQYLACCWIPHDMTIRWCIKNNISRAGWLDGAPTLDGAASKSDQPLDRAEDISLDKRRLIDKPPRPTQHQERKAYQFFGSCRAENPEIFSKTLADIQEFARQKGHNFSTSVIHRVLVRA
jgi:hypothetical protein